MIKSEAAQWLNAYKNITDARFLMIEAVGRFEKRWVMKL